jgi:hypothetical protein
VDVSLEHSVAINDLMLRWQKAIDEHKRWSVLKVSYTTGVKMFHLVIGSCSAFLVDIETGIIYGNKGWLKVDRKKIIGNAYDPTFNAAVLIRDRFRYGSFENAPDGSLRQPLLKR